LRINSRRPHTIDIAGGRSTLPNGGGGRPSRRRASALTAAVEKTAKRLGPLTLAVNSAGIANEAPAENTAFEQWERMMDVNLTGVVLSCQAERRVMLNKKRGAIVNTASMYALSTERGTLPKLSRGRRQSGDFRPDTRSAVSDKCSSETVCRTMGHKGRNTG
jgi:NAD(P)-dependent dehydrogenase (short-subunit alcohol dehydrogenase family)